MKETIQWELLRSEVLRQLLGVAGQWVVVLVATLVVYTLLGYLSRLIAQKALYARLTALYTAFTSSPTLGSVVDAKAQKRGRTALLTLVGILGVFLLGYQLGYTINANYLEGDISLIVTTSRVTHFYLLVHTLLQITLVFFSSLVLLRKHLAVHNGKSTKWLDRLLSLLSFLGVSLAYAFPLMSMAVLYINLVNN